MATRTLSAFSRVDAGRLLSAFFLATFGLGLVLALGFARIDAVHDATHDLRHSAGFPCH